MAETAIADFEVGRPTEGRFVVVRKARRLNRNGDAYLAMELSDSTGTVDARVWENVEHFDRAVQLGDEVIAVGKPSLFRDEVQFDVRRIERVGEASGNVFVPTASRSSDDLAGELDFLIDEIHDEELHALVAAIWRGPDREALLRCPATEHDHHARLSGLVEHTIAVAATCQAWCERHTSLNASVLLAAALLHDVGRVRELRTDQRIESDRDARLVGHLLLTHEMLLTAAQTVGALTHPAWANLVHCVAQHHGPLDRCRTREAMVLASCNQLDARLAQDAGASRS